MATLKQYGRTLWDLQQTVCNRIGFDLRRADTQTRAVVISIDAAFALVLQLLVTKGVFTDVELNNAVQAVRNTSFSPLGKVPMLDSSSGPDQTLPVPEPLQD